MLKWASVYVVSSVSWFWEPTSGKKQNRLTSSWLHANKENWRKWHNSFLSQQSQGLEIPASIKVCRSSCQQDVSRSCGSCNQIFLFQYMTIKLVKSTVYHTMCFYCSVTNCFDIKIVVIITIHSHYSTAQAACLIDEPKQTGQYKYPDKLPGQMYDADTQCKWQFGMRAKVCNLSFVKVPIDILVTL